MESVWDARDRLIDGLSRITGISKKKINEYAERSDVLHVIDHPAVLDITDQQYQKIIQLREFLGAYQVHRKAEWGSQELLSDTERTKNYFLSQLAYYREREMLLCAFLDSNLGVISCEKVSEGTINAVAVFPREIGKRVLQLDAAAIILAHNHPSGNLKPSQADIELTENIQKLLRHFDVPILDHIIVGGDRGISMREEAVIQFDRSSTGSAFTKVSEGEDMEYER